MKIIDHGCGAIEIVCDGFGANYFDGRLGAVFADLGEGEELVIEPSHVFITPNPLTLRDIRAIAELERNGTIQRMLAFARENPWLPQQES